MTPDEQRDDEMRRWNAALAGGDPDEIARVQDEIQRSLHERIMNDDPNYEQAGWSPT